MGLESEWLKHLLGYGTLEKCCLVIDPLEFSQDVVRVFELQLFVPQPLIFVQDLSISMSHVLCLLILLK